MNFGSMFFRTAGSFVQSILGEQPLLGEPGDHVPVGAARSYPRAPVFSLVHSASLETKYDFLTLTPVAFVKAAYVSGFT